VTAANSEFIFGRNAVIAALKGGRRTLHKLYVNERVYSATARGQEVYSQFAELASGKVQIIKVGDDWEPLMNKLSTNHTHNVRFANVFFGLLNIVGSS
jgi:tRNA G18 (ribose-2'-O)-methylase SpoU